MLTLVVGTLGALAVVQSGHGQSRLARIGYLAWAECPHSESAFLQRLRELGHVEGQTFTIECQSAQADYACLGAAAAALVHHRVDVIVALSHPTAKTAIEATREIPVVMVASGDPVRAGLVASLARPGGNATGLTYYATELTAKRLELLRETLPRSERVGVLHNPAVGYLPFLDDTRRAASLLGLGLDVVDVQRATELESAFQGLSGRRVHAVFVLPDLLLSREAPQIGRLSLKYRLPVMAWGRWFAEAGALLSYSGDYGGMSRRAAEYVDRILRGAKPADLPVEQPSRFELVLNLRTAQALGIVIPPSILARADEILR